MAPSVEAVKASCNLSGQDAPTTVIASGFSGRFVDKKATKEVQLIICYMWYPDYELSRLLSRFSFCQERAEDWSWLDLDGEGFQSILSSFGRSDRFRCYRVALNLLYKQAPY